MRKLLIASALLLPATLAAQCSSSLAASGLNSGAQYVVFMPQPSTCFKGDMIVFAHGYVPVGSPANAWLAQLALPDGTSLPALLNSLGFGFAASGFSKDGLAILQGAQDTKALTTLIAGAFPVHRFFATGASEGGLIAAKLLESDPAYSGGLAVCGPVGSFQRQVNYIGDVRVLFDYFFPGILSGAGGSAISIPQVLMDKWYTVYEPAVRKAVNLNFLATLQLLSTANIPIGLSYANAADAITGALWYNIFATNEAQTTLGGNPYDNIGRVYRGSLNDARLNAFVARFAADPAAASQIPNYETTGLLHDPLVTLHNLADPTIPFWQETQYAAKVQSTGSSRELSEIPALRYGHCNVTAGDAKAALLVMLLKAGL